METLSATMTQEIVGRLEAAAGQEEAVGRGAGLAASALQAMLVVDASGNVRHCGRAAGDLLGSSPQALRGRHLIEVMPHLPLRQDTPGYNLAYLIVNFASGGWHPACVRTEDGCPIWVELSIEVMHMGRQTLLLMSMREPVPQYQNHLERLIGSLAESPDAAVVTSPAGVIEYVNPAYEMLTGYGLSEVVGQTQRVLKSGQHPPAFYQALWETLAAGRSFHAVFANRAKSGRTFYLDQIIRPFMDRRGRITHYVATGHDVSHQIQAQEELQHRADFDGLTGLANRYLLHDRLHQEIARARREVGMFTLVCVDLDRFKAINDNRGHLAGDVALRAVSSQLLQVVREMDTLGRWGGDEFLLILPGVYEPRDVDAVLAKIVASVREMPCEPVVSTHITLSAGAAIFPVDAEDGDDLIHKADMAMYQAKLRGGDGYCAWGAALWEQGRREGLPRTGRARLRRVPGGRGHLTCVRGGLPS